MSKPLVYCLWGCGESVNPPKVKHPGGKAGFVLWTKGRPRPVTHFFRIFFLLLSNHTSLNGSYHFIFLIGHGSGCMGVERNPERSTEEGWVYLGLIEWLSSCFYEYGCSFWIKIKEPPCEGLSLLRWVLQEQHGESCFQICWYSLWLGI